MLQPDLTFDYGRLRQEAQIRWLKPSEIFFILLNHESYPIERVTPEKPPSGSLFLFNRRVLRFFRKDGHMWKKKKDGRSGNEAHERLKVENVDALNCYYAHGEKNPYFQRRSYWMLDPAYEHIVLVHYREVSEGRFLPPAFSQQPQGLLPFKNVNPNAIEGQLQGLPSSSGIYDSCQGSVGEVNSEYTGKVFDAFSLNMIKSSGISDLSSQQEVNQALLELEEQLSLDKFDNNILEDLLPACINEYENLENAALLNNEKQNSSQKFHENLIPGMERSYGQGDNGKLKSSSLVFHEGISTKNYRSWNDMLELGSSSTGFVDHIRPSDSIALASGLEPSCYPSNSPRAYHCADSVPNYGRDFQQFSSAKDIFDVPFDELEKFKLQQPSHAGENAEHKDDGIFLSSQLSAAKGFTLGSNDLESPNSVACMVAGLHRMSPAAEPGLNMAQKHLFKINEISPGWSFSFERTMVVIIGDFICSPLYAWSVMFGAAEVPAEILQQGVLRCQTPKHTSGKVTLYITSGNGEACSDAREFEFRTKPITSSVEALHHVNATMSSEELLLLVKFVQVLLRPISNGTGQTEPEHHSKSIAVEDQWLQIIDQLQAGCEISSCAFDWVLQELIKDKFQQWISSKINAKRNSNCLLSKDEQGIIHMISGLGYEWALNPTVDAGIGINFRDVNGWTALHWAARFGREKMAAALLACGALAGAVTDPTPYDPLGKTAGAIAASSGHKGLAGYLSEADLTSHLCSLMIEECQISKISATVEAEKAVESISERAAQLHVAGTEDELSLKDSLAAVRNSAQAAARIQVAFRAHSFKKRHGSFATDCSEYGMNTKEIYGLTSFTKNQRLVHSYSDQKFDKAALSIQKKYRGWKGQKKFLTLRRHAVKIQAHVRGHQVRKRYKEFLWTVGVFEKVVLRWRRGGAGLRGFRPVPYLSGEREEDEDIVKIFRKQKVDFALDQAFSRVLSMAESPRARQQYRRMLLTFHSDKAGEYSTDEAILHLQENLERMQDDEFLHWLR